MFDQHVNSTYKHARVLVCQLTLIGQLSYFTTRRCIVSSILDVIGSLLLDLLSRLAPC